MKDRADKYIAERIRWKAEKYTNCINFFNYIDLTNQEIQQEIGTYFSNKSGGEPIQVYLLNSESWTTIGTEKLINKHYNDSSEVTFTEVRLDDIEHAIAEDKRVKILEPSTKTDLTLTLKTGGTIKLPVQASDIFQLWNILLMLCQLQR